MPHRCSWTEQSLAAGPQSAPDPSPCMKDPRLVLAMAHQQAGRMEEALALYDALLNDFPGDPTALHCFGMFCHHMGDDALASQLIELSISLSPDMPIAHASLGIVKASLGDYEGAVECCRRAIVLSPNLVTAHGNLGGFLLALGQPREAAEAFRTAIALAPSEATGYCGLGGALFTLGDRNGAEGAFNHALRLNPDDADAHRGLGLLKGNPEAGRQAACPAGSPSTASKIASAQ